MTAPPLERDYDIDILEAQVAVDEEFETWLREFLGSRVKEKGGLLKNSLIAEESAAAEANYG